MPAARRNEAWTRYGFVLSYAAGVAPYEGFLDFEGDQESVVMRLSRYARISSTSNAAK
jgi:hypothetical protein